MIRTQRKKLFDSTNRASTGDGTNVSVIKRNRMLIELKDRRGERLFIDYNSYYIFSTFFY